MINEVDIKELCILKKLSNNEYEITKVKEIKKSKIKNFKIPNYITKIGKNAFNGCKSLNSIIPYQTIQ